MRFAKRIMGAVVASAARIGGQPAAAYPIDCAILLCLAGGFPASAECGAAKAEMIRRITPWPIEPPLQLWNCPLSIPADLAAVIGMVDAGLGSDGLTDEVRGYRDGVEIYHIASYSRRNVGGSEGGLVVIDNTSRGDYDAAGNFSWVGSSYENGPAWLAEVVGGTRISIRTCVRENRSGNCLEYKVLREENRASGGAFGSLRGVAIRTKDYEGNYTTEFVAY